MQIRSMLKTFGGVYVDAVVDGVAAFGADLILLELCHYHLQLFLFFLKVQHINNSCNFLSYIINYEMPKYRQ